MRPIQLKPPINPVCLGLFFFCGFENLTHLNTQTHAIIHTSWQRDSVQTRHAHHAETVLCLAIKQSHPLGFRSASPPSPTGIHLVRVSRLPLTRSPVMSYETLLDYYKCSPANSHCKNRFINFFGPNQVSGVAQNI